MDQIDSSQISGFSSERLKEMFGLVLGEYCGEDDSYSVLGKIPSGIINLEDWKKRPSHGLVKVLWMERLKVLYIIRNSASLQIHENGTIVINHVKNLDAATAFLREVICAKL